MLVDIDISVVYSVDELSGRIPGGYGGVSSVGIEAAICALPQRLSSVEVCLCLGCCFAILVVSVVFCRTSGFQHFVFAVLFLVENEPHRRIVSPLSRVYVRHLQLHSKRKVFSEYRKRYESNSFSNEFEVSYGVFRRDLRSLSAGVFERARAVYRDIVLERRIFEVLFHSPYEVSHVFGRSLVCRRPRLVEIGLFFLYLFSFFEFLLCFSRKYRENISKLFHYYVADERHRAAKKL